MSIFVFTDGKCFLYYIYQANFSLFEKLKHIMSLHTIKNVLLFIYLSLFVSLTYDITC